MTTVQTMFAGRGFGTRSGGRRGRGAYAGGLLAIAGCALLAACEGGARSELVPPEVLVAPYDAARGDVLWAVAPLGNESGYSSVDSDQVADALVAKIDEVRGLACLPLNRVIAAMRSRNMRGVRTPGEARQLAMALGVDGLIVGNITDYEPYDPPRIGLSLALYSRELSRGEGFDPMKLRGSYTDYGQVTRSQFADRPAAVVSEHLDGANHEVQMELRRYASGRHDGESALGWRAGLASMGLYTEFAAYFAVSRILEQERLRLGQPGNAVRTAEAPETRQP